MISMRQAFLRPFLLSLLLVSALSSKVLHLFQHVSSLPPALFVVFFPTFFVQELLLCGAAWFLLTRSTRLGCVLGLAATASVALLTFVLASSQIGFYFVTGSEVRWDAATSIGNDPEGRKLMLSGMKSFLCAATFILVLSGLGASAIWLLVTSWLTAVFSTFSSAKNDEELPLASLRSIFRRERLVRLWTICAVLVTAGLHIFRPSIPYNHLSGALPFTFFDALRSKRAESQPGQKPFPFPELLGEQFWEPPREHFKGWAPGSSSWERNSSTRPAWVSESLPDGLLRWTQKEAEFGDKYKLDEDEESERFYYDPVQDPLRITNLDSDIMQPLAEAFRSREVPITHVVLVMMESARKDVFPFKSGSHLHQEIISSHGNAKAKELKKIDEKLAHLTPIAEMLTGETGGFPGRKGSKSELWKDTAEAGMGGINIHGLLTGSSLSFKSAVMNYCGVGPIPVDFMGEVHSDIYQPCIMQIFDLFNQLKNSTTSPKSSQKQSTHDQALNRNWTSVFLQSITGQFDDQDKLNDMMGFKKTVYREDIRGHWADHYHENMEEINYFGYPEVEVYPYLKDVINETIVNNERLFLSHFTSTTHHPWATPSDFEDEQYFAHDSLTGKHKDMNSYLNTVRYVDTWLGDILKALDEFGIAKETLVVFVGDHGQAFQEDSSVQGTYENGHVSNFRIPLVFRHPLLPKIQVTANASSMSIVPTILDLLVQTKSLDERDSSAALDLMNEYEGQSLIRPYQATRDGRQAWNIGIINAGGTMLSVGSAAVPYRLILPLTEDFEYVFSNSEADPNELKALRGWSMADLLPDVQKDHGEEAGQWMTEAAQVGQWWVEERKRLWNHE